MNYNEFKDYVKEHVLDYLPEQYKKSNIAPITTNSNAN